MLAVLLIPTDGVEETVRSQASVLPSPLLLYHDIQSENKIEWRTAVQ